MVSDRLPDNMICCFCFDFCSQSVLYFYCLLTSGDQKSVLHRRSKRLQGKPSRVQDLDGRDTDDDIPENSSSSSEDGKAS
jgi:hypothetical protein